MHVHALLSERHACRGDCSRTTSRRAARWQSPKQALMRSAQQRRVHKTRFPSLQSAVTMRTLPQPRRARRAARAASPRRTSKGPCRAAHSPARARARSSQPSPGASARTLSGLPESGCPARAALGAPSAPQPAGAPAGGGARALVGGVSRKDAWLCWNPGPKAGQRSSGQDSVSVYR